MAATIATRAALRAAVVDALLDGVSVSGRILVARSWPVPGPGQAVPQALPALLVQDGPRILSGAAQGFGRMRCQMRVLARVAGRDDATREAALDALDTEIRAALRSNAALAALVLVVEEIATDRETSVEGQLTLAEDQHMVTFLMAGFD